jgi:hemerythrin superfamily protein
MTGTSSSTLSTRKVGTVEIPDSLSVPRNHDIVTLVIRDHEAIQRLLDSLGPVDSDGAPARCWQASYELIRHEVAEEQVVYPSLHQCGAGAAEVGRRGLAEQADVEHLLDDVEKVGPAGHGFEQALDALQGLVQRHAAFEEDEILPLIADRLSDEQRFELGDQYAQAKKVAPTHPHPHLSGNDKLPMSAAAIADRVRDAMSRSRPRPNRSAGPNVSSGP